MSVGEFIFGVYAKLLSRCTPDCCVSACLCVCGPFEDMLIVCLHGGLGSCV